MIYEVRLTGTGSMILSTQRGADPTNPLVKELATLTRIPGPKKTEQNHADIARIQFVLNLPWDDEMGVHIPAPNLWNAVIDAARADRKGTTVEKFVTPLAERYKLIYPGAEALDDLVADTSFRDTRLVNHGSRNNVSMVLHTRPIFRPWAVVSEWDADQEYINGTDFEKWWINAGKTGGLGAYRKMFGRFKAEVRPLS